MCALGHALDHMVGISEGDVMQIIKESQSYRRPVLITGPGIRIARHDMDEHYKERIGNDLPRHKQIVANRENATTELWGTSWSYKESQGYLEFTEEGKSTPYTDNSGGFVLTGISGRLPSNPDINNVKAAAAKCSEDYFRKLKALRTPLQGQVVLGELRETLNLLRNPFKTGTKLIEGLLTRRYNKIKIYESYLVAYNRKFSSLTERKMWETWLSKNTMKNIGDLWLEFRFGVLPLMQDIEDTMKLLASICSFDDVQTHKAYGKSEIALSEVRKWAGVYGVNQHTLHKSVDKAESIIRFGYRTKVQDSTESLRSQVSESFLNIRDVPGTAWELMPWSFFIDYFVNVGSIIESVFESQENVVWLSRCDISTLTEQAVGFAAIPIAPKIYNVRRFSPTMYQVTRRKIHRYSTPVGITPVAFSYPSSNVRLANIAALLTGFLSNSRGTKTTYR